MKEKDNRPNSIRRTRKKVFLSVSIALVIISGFLWAFSTLEIQIVRLEENVAESSTNASSDSAPSSDSDVLATSPTPAYTWSSCLTSTQGSVINLSGSSSSYKNKSLEQYTKIDATMAIFENGGEHPVSIGGGPDICWHSGKIYGGYPLDARWKTTHPTAGLQIQDGTFRPIIEGVYIEQIGDGIKVRLGERTGQEGIAEPFTVRGVWLRDIRDDCIESDWQAGAVIGDSLLDGCYVAFATRKRPSASTDGSNNTWEIRNTLVYLHDQIGVYGGSGPGHGMFFKWDETSPKWEMYNSILRVDSDVSQSSNQFNFQLDKLVDCQNNILVWLGDGPFPAPLPSCFTVTKDKSVWDNAVTIWKIQHGFVSQFEQ